MSSRTVEKNVSDVSYFMDFQSMNQRQDLDKIPNNATPLAVNVSFDKPSTISKRKGSSLTGTTQAGNGVYGLIPYVKNDGTIVLRAVRSTDLDAYSEVGDAWAAIDSGQFAADEKIQSVNFNNRVYHMGTTTYLCWENGSSCTTVGSGSDRLRGNSLAVAQNTLFVGGIVGNEDRIYYSLYDITTNTPSDTFWNTDEGSLSASTRFFTLLAPVKGLFSYGNRCLAFTKDKCFRFDMQNADNGTGVENVFNIGLANPRAITEVNGFIVWMSPDKRIWAWGGAGQPNELSWAIEDDENGEAIINQISDSIMGDVCAGAVRNKFYFSVGDVTYRGETFENVLIKGLVSQTFGTVLFSIDTLPWRPTIFANMNFSGQEVLVFGVDDVDDIYVYNLGVNDGTEAIDARYYTKFYDFGLPFHTKDIDEILIKIRPQSTANTFLTVRQAVDNIWDFEPLSTPDDGSPVTKHAVIDMYNDGDSDKYDRVYKLSTTAGTNFRTISLCLENAELNESFEVSGIGFKLRQARPLDVRPQAA